MYIYKVPNQRIGAHSWDLMKTSAVWVSDDLKSEIDGEFRMSDKFKWLNCFY